MKIRVSGIILAGVILLSGSSAFAQTIGKKDTTVNVNFKDISNHWSGEAVQYLMKKDAIPFSQDKLVLGKAVSRSEFAVMLHNGLDIKIEYFKEPDIKDYFDDIKQDAAYAPAVTDLVTAGVFEGKGSFKPNASITREEMVHYIMQAYRYKMGDRYELIKINPASFKDVDSITPEYGGDVARAQHYKLIAGTGNNMFQPEKAASRAETAVVIDKLIKLLAVQNQYVDISPDAIVTSDSIEMKLKIKNNSEKDIILNHSSGQKFDFALLDADRNVIYRWSADKMFTMALTSTRIEPGKSLEFSDTLSGDVYAAIKDKVVYLKAYLIGSSDSFSIDDNGYEIKVK